MYVAQITYMIVLSEKSHDIFINLILSNWNIVHMDSLELIVAESIHSLEKFEDFCSFFFQSLTSVYMQSQLTKKNQLSLYDCLVSLRRWDSWWYHFAEEVRVGLRPCTPWERLWLKQQKQLS